MFRDPGLLTVLPSKPLSRHSLVQILRSSTKKCSDAASLQRFWFPNRSRATAWCKFCRPDLPKVLASCHLSTSLTSKPLSRHSLVQILRPATSKSRPAMPVFCDFGFQTALLPQRSANFADILGSRSFAPARFWGLPLQATAAAQLWTNVAFNSYPPTRPRLTRLYCITFARSHFFLKDVGFRFLHFFFESSIWCKSIGCRICMSLAAGLPCVPTFRVPSSQVKSPEWPMVGMEQIGTGKVENR